MDNNVGFIGVGNMGMALLKGYANKSDGGMYAFDLDNGKKTAVELLGARFVISESEVVKNCKYVVLACKPQSLSDILERIKPFVTAGTVLISICAGISEKFIQKYIGNVKIALVMPNTPMMIGKGAAAFAGAGLTGEELDFVEKIMTSCGIAKKIPIDKMKEIIPVNGSSPAFICLYAQCFIDCAVSNGIDIDTARELFAMTLIGAGEMILNSGISLEKLIEQVSSKGGTTVAGLEKLNDGKLADIVKSASDAAIKRAYELGGE